MKNYSQFIFEAIKKDPRSLIPAIKNYDIEKLKNLINAGVNVNYQDKDGNCPLLFAIDQNYKEAVRLLLDAGANVFLLNNCMVKDDAYTYSIKKGNYDIVKMILEKVDYVNKKYSDNKNVLQKAIRNKGQLDIHFNKEIIKLLVDRGLDLNNIESEDNSNALISSLMMDLNSIAAYILEYDIDINHQDGWGNTCLFYVDTVSLFKKILEKGVDVTIKNNIDRTFEGNTTGKKMLDIINNTEDLQRWILKSRPDTINFFNSKVNWYDEIKEEFKDLFSAGKWGLTV